MQRVDVLIGELQTLLNERSRRIPPEQKLMEVSQEKPDNDCMFKALQAMLSENRAETNRLMYLIRRIRKLKNIKVVKEEEVIK